MAPEVLKEDGGPGGTRTHLVESWGLGKPRFSQRRPPLDRGATELSWATWRHLMDFLKLLESERKKRRE